MTAALPILVFSDLDGTLLDHRDYRWDAALPVLDRLRAVGGGLILATSKTAAEVASLRADLGWSDWPAIVENGAGLLEARAAPTDDPGTYPDLRAALAGLPPGFRGFADLGLAGIVQATGLSPEAARRAAARQFSEPGLWTGAEGDLGAFLAAADRAGLVAQQGGRFLTLSFGGTKAGRMGALIDRYRPGLTVALGDAPNDIQMLAAADLGVVVANPTRPPLPPLPGEGAGRIRRTARPGPEGWAEAMADILDTHFPKQRADRHG